MNWVGIQHVGKSVKTAHVSIDLIQWRYITDQQSAHSHWCVTSQSPNETAFTASSPRSLPSHGHSRGVSSDLTAFALQVIFSKLSINSPLKPDFHQQNSSLPLLEVRWGFYKVQTDQLLVFMSQFTGQIHQTSHIFLNLCSHPTNALFAVLSGAESARIEHHKECYFCTS